MRFYQIQWVGLGPYAGIPYDRKMPSNFPLPGRRRALACLAILANALCHQAVATADTELVLCYEDENVRPWRTQDGRGLNFELLDQVAAGQGLRFRYLGTPWKRCLHELKNNVHAGAIGASFKPERLANGAYPRRGELQADPSRALYVDRYVVVRRKGTRVDWDGKRFVHLDRAAGAPLGYSVADDLRRAGIPVDDGAQTAADVLQKLLRERIDVAVLLQGELVSLLAETPEWRDRLDILPRPFVEKPYYLLLSHRLVQSNPQLAEQLWNGIARERARPAWQEKERRALER